MSCEIAGSCKITDFTFISFVIALVLKGNFIILRICGTTCMYVYKYTDQMLQESLHHQVNQYTCSTMITDLILILERLNGSVEHLAFWEYLNGGAICSWVEHGGLR